MTASPERGSVRATRRRLLTILVAMIIVSFAIAAVAGIVVLIAGPTGDLMSRVLITTVIVGGFSVGALSCMSLWGRPLHAFGVAGAAVNALSAAIALVSVWVDVIPSDFWWVLNRLLPSGIIVSVGWALSALLLLLAGRRRRVIRIGLIITLALAAAVVLLAVAGVWSAAISDAEAYPRVLGTIGILCALGVVVVPVLALLVKDPRSGAGDPFPAELAERLTDLARQRGVSVAELVAPLFGQATESSTAARRADPDRPEDPPTLNS